VTVAAQAALLARLSELELGRGQVALWHLGQSSFALRAAGATVLIDPYLAPHSDRLVPPPFAPEEATGVDVIACTHDHLDHLDRETLPALAAASPAAIVIVPTPFVDDVARLGVPSERIVGAQPGETIEIGSLVIHVLPACHGDDPAAGYGFGRERSGGLYRFLGYVLEAGGTPICHAGDTIPFDGLEELLREHRVDLALLPINGRDAVREALGIVGNLDEREAAHLAAGAGVDALVPMHYDMFEANPGSPARLVEIVHRERLDVAVFVLSRTRPFVYSPAR
jgi:L-ascorbate metabolism protein UlaG (beta-lactamase superfamily)